MRVTLDRHFDLAKKAASEAGIDWGAASRAAVVTVHPANDLEWEFLREWAKIEDVLDATFRARGDTKYRTIRARVRQLEQDQLLSSDLASVLVELSKIRTELTHGERESFVRSKPAEVLGLLRSTRDRVEQSLKLDRASDMN